MLEAGAKLPSYRRHWGLSARTRYQLGECDALAAAIRSSPLRPEEQRRLLDAALAEGARATVSLAGHPRRPGDGQSRHARGRPASGRVGVAAEERPTTATERNAAATAYRMIEEVATGTASAADGAFLRGVHRRIGDGLGHHFGGIPGRYRGEGPTRPEAPRANRVPGLVDGLFRWLDREFAGGDDFGDTVVRAVVTHVYLIWIRPFEDGNGRVARMLESHVLLAAGVPAIASQIPVRFYHRTHTEYRRQLEVATRDRSLTSFIAYAAEGLRDGLCATLDEIQRLHFASAWRGFVFETFDRQPHRKHTVFERRRDLMLAFPLRGGFTPDEVVALDAGTAQRYGALSPRTLHRDLNILVRIGLVTAEKGRYSANTAALRLI